jgi:hypothetical protein
MLGNIVKNDRFALFVLASAMAAGAIWYLRPQTGWLPLLIALAPWLLRAVIGSFAYQPALTDLPMALFMATAAGSLWLSYDQEAANAKYWLIIGAVLIFYAAAHQSRQNLWLLTGFLILLGIGVGVYFLLTHDWQVQPARIEFFNRVGLRIMSVRPTLGLDTIHPNVAAGLTALIFPFPVALGLRALRSKNQWRIVIPGFLFAVGSGVFFIFVLLVTTSRGAWLALGAALVLWLAWEGSLVMSDNGRKNPQLIFAVTLLTLAVIGLFIVFTYPGGPVALINQLPGPSNVGSRSKLVRDTFYLIGDFSLIGAGLASFPGLYSNYILILPSFVLGHSHNLLLDITLEQGPLGVAAFLGVWGGSLWLMLRPKSGERRIRHLSLLQGAVASSSVILLLHGLIDDPLYGSRAVLFLFLIPGFAVAISKSRSREKTENNHKKRRFLLIRTRTFVAGTALMFVALVFYVLLSRNQILSDWYANRGAIEMARVELADWPTDQWDDGRHAANLAPAEALFNQALTYNQMNNTAHYRLGLIAMLKRDFEKAIGHLEAAQQLEPNNQGIWKTLGYSYLWLGDFDNAFTRLRAIPESRQELNVYVTWWANQGRPDLAGNAAIMEQRLQSIEILPAN